MTIGCAVSEDGETMVWIARIGMGYVFTTKRHDANGWTITDECYRPIDTLEEANRAARAMANA